MGAAGGLKILPAVLQTLLNVEWGMDASGAVEYGRVHDQLYPKQISADNILPKPILDGLVERGHNVTGAFDADAPALISRGRVLAVFFSR